MEEKIKNKAEEGAAAPSALPQTTHQLRFPLPLRSFVTETGGTAAGGRPDDSPSNIHDTCNRNEIPDKPHAPRAWHIMIESEDMGASLYGRAPRGAGRLSE